MPKGIFIRTNNHNRNLGLAHVGMKHTESAKLKMRIAKLGHKQTKEQIEKRCAKLRGENHWTKKIGGFSEIHRLKISNSLTGKPTWNKGKKMSKEWCKRISNMNRGRFVGSKSPLWSGKCELNQLIRSSFEMNNWRKEIFKRDNFSCRECGANRSTNSKIEAHHIKSFATIVGEFLKIYSQFSPFEDKETLFRLATSYEPLWDMNNGITLCESCHKKTKSHPRVTVKDILNS